MLNPDLLDWSASELRRLQVKAVVVANPLRHVGNHADLTAGHGHEVLLDVLAKALGVAGDKTPDRRVADGERLGGPSFGSDEEQCRAGGYAQDHDSSPIAARNILST